MSTPTTPPTAAATQATMGHDLGLGGGACDVCVRA